MCLISENMLKLRQLFAFISSGTTEQSLESKPVRVTMIYEKVQLQYDAMTSSRMGPPTDLSTVF